MHGNSSPLIQVVDDDPRIRRLVRVNLEQRGYRVAEAETGEEAIARVQREFPDLMVLDLVMPGRMSGCDVCVWVRERSDIPIIVMSAQDQEDLKVSALDAGADDYITKPFGQEEFMARIRALFRRALGTGETRPITCIELGNLMVDLRARRVYVAGQEVRLTKTEFALVAELAREPDTVISHDELLRRVWGPEYVGASHYLHVYFGRIRKKLGPVAETCLESVPGVGYVIHPQL
ncbi:MAG: response regulator transcription factor [Chloroflexota bacterium]